MINVKINGIPLTLDKPMRVIDAAAKVGVHVPHFCYHPELTVHAGCRICMIEVKGRPKLMAGCAVIMSDGMEVITESEKITEARRGVLELQLTHHPLDCPQCDKGGECLLQDYAFKYGAGRSRFREEKREIPVSYANPLLERNMERCVACKRCVRICSEIQGDWVLSDMQRGSKVVFDSFMGSEKDCVHCGHCLSTCPVGAIQSRLYKHSERPWYVEREAETICPYCGDGCTLTLQSRGNRITRALSDETFSKGANRGSLCVRGRFGYDYPNSPERLVSPLIKKDGYFVEATWDEAAAFVADRLAAIKASSGPDSIGAVTGGRNTNEESYLLQKMMRAVVGSNNVDSIARLGHINAISALEHAFGVPAMTNSIKDIAKANAVLLIGCDAAAENPITGLAVKRAVFRKGASLIVADAGRNAMEKHAAMRLTYRPDTALAFVQGVVSAIFALGLQDKALEEGDQDGFSHVKKLAAEYTPGRASEITGVPVSSIEDAARVFAEAEAASIVFGRGVTASRDGYLASLALAGLSYITGNVGKPGGGVNPMTSKANEQGACDAGMLPDRLPGHARVDSDEDRKKLGDLWGADIPAEPGMTLTAMLDAAAAGKLKALWVMGMNPVFEMPGRAAVEKALGKLGLLVVQDIFMSETAQMAHVVLPAASFAEKEGTFTNSERRVQRIYPVMDPVGDSKPDGEIIAMVAEKMGRPMAWAPAGVMEEISQAAPLYAGMSYPLLFGGGVQWPVGLESAAGTQVLHTAGITPSRQAPLQAAAGEAVPAGGEFPFFADITVSLYHSGTTTRYTKGPNMIENRAAASLNPIDASSLGLSDGDRVSVRSAAGVMTLPASIDAGVPRGVVHLVNHYKDACAGVLTEAGSGMPGGVPAARYWPVSVTKAEE